MFHRPPKFDWLETVPILRRVGYEPDALIVSGAEPDERMVYIVLAGTVRLSLLTADGREQVLIYLPVGSVFGEQAALGGGQVLSDLAAIADESCEVGQIRAADIVAVLKTRAGALRDIMRVTGEKTSFFLEAAARSAFGSARTRVASVLSAISGKSDRVAISQERLARLCGTTRVTIAAHLHKLEQEGAISIGRGAVTIRDSSKLITACA